MSRPSEHLERLAREPGLRAGLVVACLVLGACTSAPPEGEPQRPGRVVERTDATPAESAAALALTLVGTPYRYGGDDPDAGFDCSGLVYYSYMKNGVRVPRTSLQLFKATRKIALTDARRGDLVFFQDQEKLSHVGIYLGDGRFVHAPSSGRTVSVADIEAEYYQRHLVAVGRVITR